MSERGLARPDLLSLPRVWWEVLAVPLTVSMLGFVIPRSLKVLVIVAFPEALLSLLCVV